jgi:lysophospholipase-1
MRSNEDETGMLATRAYIHRLIQQEVDAGIPPNRIVIGGFSQGGAMALLSGLSHPWQLGGIVGLSCWLLFSSKFSETYREENRGVPVFMGHGTADPLVPLSLAKESKGMLVAAGFNVKMQEYR